MPESDTSLQPLDGEIMVEACQLRPGVFVRLPGSWLNHEFLFNAFVIADEEQVRQIAALNLPRLFCDPGRSRVPPLPKVVAPPPPPDPVETARREAAAARKIAEKRQRVEVMKELRGRLDSAQRHYTGAARAVVGAIGHFDIDPKESVRQVTRVSEDSTAALLADPDSALVLIAEKARDEGSAAHSLSVMTLTLLLGKQAGLPREVLAGLGIGALLHDIGKVGIKPAILRNTQRNRFEEEIYRQHCRNGYESAQRAGTLSKPMLEAILHHHERYDGRGFPDGLTGDASPLAARMIAITNRFDNLTNPPDYRQALSPSEALSTMWARERESFDPVLLQLFVRAMGVYPPGSVVALGDGRIGAVVVSAPPASPLCPQVMIYEPSLPRSQALIVDLARESELTIERALRLQDRADAELDYLLPRRKLNWFHGTAPA